ncbi:hypothetical protein [Telluribacter humicola]|uniref:hypothetical protein n=1 Tax=Telluribacter humicola TaxID=1720261 RepID=UPI001A9587D0|nr:hypothetical protein [Telluribacter humicola]
MQNERLYNKIRHTALTETPDVEEWNPERAWAKVGKKRSRSVVWLWLPLAAASVLLVLGLFVRLSNRQNENALTISKADKVILKRPLPTKELSIQKGTVVVHKMDQVPKKHKPEEYLTSNQFAKESEYISLDTVMDALPVKEVVTEEVALVMADITKLEQPAATNLEKATEKVLVAYISIPEQKEEELSALRQMYDQVKQDREARKMRTRLSVTGRKPSLWSFVHHSFVEYPSDVKPLYLPANK